MRATLDGRAVFIGARKHYLVKWYLYRIVGRYFLESKADDPLAFENQNSGNAVNLGLCMYFR
jgi:hypothetical protein